MNTALTRRESLWADEPVMRDGKCLDLGLKALGSAMDVQHIIHSAFTSAKPDAWLADAEIFALELLGHIRSMRAVLK